jgi:hypothetical protein
MGGFTWLPEEAIVNSSILRKRGRVTVPGHLGDDLHPGTLKSVLKQAGIRKAKS